MIQIRWVLFNIPRASKGLSLDCLDHTCPRKIWWLSLGSCTHVRQPVETLGDKRMVEAGADGMQDDAALYRGHRKNTGSRESRILG